MEKRELTREEIISLIGEFKSEAQKCLAKIEFFNDKINELTARLGGQYVYTPTIAEKKRKPYPLSKWDKIVLEVVRENGEPTTSKTIYDRSIEKAVADGIAMTEDKMKAKINQCLVKLSGRRDDLKKVKYGGRGFAYSFPEWINN